MPPEAMVAYTSAISATVGEAEPSTLDGTESRPGVSSGRPSSIAVSIVCSGPISMFASA